MNPPTRAPCATAAAWVLALSLLVGTALPAAASEPTTCPALADATQVQPCPTEDQLRLGYIGYCSDNRLLYGGDTETCGRFENYRRLKNVALWEAGADGAFQGYLSCDMPRERIAAALPSAVTVNRQGTLTRVSCRYGDGVMLTMRTKARCAVVGTAPCAGDPAACRVQCD